MNFHMRTTEGKSLLIDRDISMRSNATDCFNAELP